MREREREITLCLGYESWRKLESANHLVLCRNGDARFLHRGLCSLLYIEYHGSFAVVVVGASTIVFKMLHVKENTASLSTDLNNMVTSHEPTDDDHISSWCKSFPGSSRKSETYSLTSEARNQSNPSNHYRTHYTTKKNWYGSTFQVNIVWSAYLQTSCYHRHFFGQRRQHPTSKPTRFVNVLTVDVGREKTPSPCCFYNVWFSVPCRTHVNTSIPTLNFERGPRKNQNIIDDITPLEYVSHFKSKPPSANTMREKVTYQSTFIFMGSSTFERRERRTSVWDPSKVAPPSNPTTVSSRNQAAMAVIVTKKYGTTHISCGICRLCVIFSATVDQQSFFPDRSARQESSARPQMGLLLRSKTPSWSALSHEPNSSTSLKSRTSNRPRSWWLEKFESSDIHHLHTR